MYRSCYQLVWKLGSLSGCHQLPERSFFWKGKQFPVCARCTGAFIGNLLGAVTFLFVRLPLWLCFLLCFVMFLDWYIQYLELLTSNNIRRLVTGILCGGGLMQIYLNILIRAFHLLIR